MNGRRCLLVAGWIVLAFAAGCADGGADRDGGEPDVIDAEAHANSDDFANGEADVAAMPDADTDVSSVDTLEVMEVMETGEADVGADAASDSDGDGACTHQGFLAMSTTAETSLATEGGFLYLAAADSLAEPANVFGLELLLNQRETGPYDFTSENYATCERCVRIDAGCTNEGGCDTIFLVNAGRMDIIAWEDPGGHFTVTFTDLHAIEVTVAAEMPMTSTPVDGGETWCIDELTVDVTALDAM